MLSVSNNRRRYALLSTSCMSTSTMALFFSAAPLLAQTGPGVGCELSNGACVYITNGTPGPAAPQDGGTGGNGGPAGDFTLNVEGTPSLVADEENIYAPINAVAQGGDGAQGSNQPSGGSDEPGASGGTGGAGGNMTVNITSGVTATSTDQIWGLPGAYIASAGGTGGATSKGNLNGGNGPAHGIGGDAGTITATLDGTFNSQAFESMIVQSVGGTGGRGRDYGTGLEAQGADGANGGNGNEVNVTLSNAAGSGQHGWFGYGGAVIQSLGGAGGGGGSAESSDGNQGGTGGNGGNGLDVNVTVQQGVNITQQADQDGALQVLSIGGSGGVGGSDGGTGGIAGAGGNAGNVTIAFTGGNIQAAGQYSPGVLAQSLGGNGGDGGSASHFVVGPNGGAGNIGGTAGTVTITGSALTVSTGNGVAPSDQTSSQQAPGVLAQSIGGGGGSGSDAQGWFAVGGNGANGVDGNNVTVYLQSNIFTHGFGSDGLVAQSIGGGGGRGGDASGTSAGLNMVIGGSGGGGGNGADVQLTSTAGSKILTTNSHASGILIQSVGGGGGSGGSAYSKTESGGFGWSMSVGGSGGAGGTGGNVTWASGVGTNNEGRILTSGSDSYGILAQSIGGGGGAGGASTAKASVQAVEGVSIAASLAIGGSGGQGGNAGQIDIGNSGLIATQGAGSVGMLIQSVGGGGGAGGDASSTSSAAGGEYGFSGSFSFGGSAGSAGAGGNASGINNGMIVTTGESADGMLVQSVGGGGGIGGSGDGKATSSSENSLSLTLNMGGKGGAGGDGWAVTARNGDNSNVGTIITLGDGANGVAAQSIGGGGGRGGGGAGSSQGQYSATVNIGASGGSGGTTLHTSGGDQVSEVNVLNGKGSTILTFGGDANGIIAQSIGGAGGAGGKASTSLATKKSTNDGGNGSASTAGVINAAVNNYDNNPASLQNYAGLNNALTFANSLLDVSASNVRSVVGDEDVLDDALDETSQSKGETDDDNESTNIELKVGVGGQGGGGGTAGAVIVTNNGEIGTMGHMADGILAQAIGGGGGKGGAASTATTNSDAYQGAVAVGGKGASGGDGGSVVVTNTGSIYTQGALAAGIVGQSISGSGGAGGASASSVSDNQNSDEQDGAFQALEISVGGNSGAGGTANQVQVFNSGAIKTKAHDSIGIVAQSIAGGGGIVKTIATDREGAGGSASSKGTDYDVQFKFNGQTGSSSTSGYVMVKTTDAGAITTKGDNSYGVLAQSIAGGGGLQLGGKPVGNNASDFFADEAFNGNVEDNGTNDPTNPFANSGVFVDAGADITTSGAGAIGILAQSIGGGGGLAGDTSASNLLVGLAGTNSKANGNGGYVGITVENGATVSTSGVNAPAIFVQSIGGGGGRVTTADGAYIGTAGGTGIGRQIDITVNGTVQATGQGSAAIMAQSQGDSTSNSPITVTVGSTGKVYAGLNDVPTSNFGLSAGVYINHGGMDSGHANVITNNGTIYTYGSVMNSVSIYNSAGYTEVINNGTIGGSILLTNDGGTGCFTNNGTYSGAQVTVGACGATNNGVVDVRGTSLSVQGNLTNNPSGKIVVAADFSGKTGAALTVDGDAKIGGQIEVHPTVMRKATVTLATASGTLSLDPTIASASDTHLYSFAFDTDGKALHVTPSAHFSDQASGFGANQRAVADNLQSLFDSGAAMDKGFARLGGVNGDADYSASLSSISGRALGAIGAFRFNSSRTFAMNLYGGCSGAPLSAKETDSCVWGRVLVNGSNQKEGIDTLGYRATATAWQMGGQIQLSPDLALTGSMAYERSNLRDKRGGARVNGDALVGGIGALYASGAVELSGGVDAAYGWYNSSRKVTVAGLTDQADAKPQQWQVGAHVRAAYSLPLGGSGFFRPFVEGHAIHVVDKAFTETGNSPFSLAVEGRADTALIGVAGAELGSTLKLNHTLAFRPFASAAVEFGSHRDWITTARFADQPQSDSFDIKTAGPGTLGRFSIGAELLGLKNVSLSVQYVPEVGKGYTSNSGLARLTWRF